MNIKENIVTRLGHHDSTEKPTHRTVRQFESKLNQKKQRLGGKEEEKDDHKIKSLQIICLNPQEDLEGSGILF